MSLVLMNGAGYLRRADTGMRMTVTPASRCWQIRSTVAILRSTTWQPPAGALQEGEAMWNCLISCAD